MRLIKYSFLCYLAGIFPIVCLFIYNYISPESSFTEQIFRLAQGHARATSERYFIVSTISSAWVKLAPLFSVLTYIFIRKIPVSEYSKGAEFKKMLKSLPVLILFILFMVFMYYFGNQDLSTSKLILRVVSADYTLLLIYYLISFLGCYFIGCFLFLYLHVLHNSFKYRP